MIVAVVDYGMGNLRSVSKAIEHVAPRATVRVTASAGEIAGSDRVVVPGQGAMPDCMAELARRGLEEPVRRAAREKPFLGICVGLQMLFESSEEGDTPGLRIFRGRVRRFNPSEAGTPAAVRLKIPHMGWNEVEQTTRHALWSGIAPDSRFYFVHSYYPEPAEAGVECGRTRYGAAFTAAVAQDNIFAVQFHPEKSQASGLRLLENFVEWRP